MKKLRAIGFAGAATFALAVAIAPSASADYYDVSSGRIICTTQQCSIAQALSRGDVSAAATFQNQVGSRPSAVVSSLSRVVATSTQSQAPATVTSASTTYERQLDAWNTALIQYQKDLAAWAASNSSGSGGSAPGIPASVTAEECRADDPVVVVTYTSVMPTFSVTRACAGTLEVRWAYTVNGDATADFNSVEFAKMNGDVFTPPAPSDPKINGIAAEFWNWKGSSVGGSGYSSGYSGWNPVNQKYDPDKRPFPDYSFPGTYTAAAAPVAILPVWPMPKANTASGPVATSVPLKSVKCLNRKTFKKVTLKGKTKCPAGWIRI